MVADRERSPEAQAHLSRYAFLAGPVRGLDLQKRVPEFMRQRGWPAEDEDLVTCITAAVGLSKIGAGATPIYRPPTADALRGAWPADSAHTGRCQLAAQAQGLMLGRAPTCKPHFQCISASELVVKLDLDELLQNR
jgi:hypothetical protein